MRVQQEKSHEHADADASAASYNVGMGKKQNPNELRRRLQEFMDERELSRNSWATAAGISPSTLYNFFRGESSDLTRNTLFALAQSQGVSVATLTGDTDAPALSPVADLASARRVMPIVPAILREVIIQALETLEKGDKPQDVADAILEEYYDRVTPPDGDPKRAIRERMRAGRKKAHAS